MSISHTWLIQYIFNSIRYSFEDEEGNESSSLALLIGKNAIRDGDLFEIGKYEK